jgi:hypothetical protein
MGLFSSKSSTTSSSSDALSDAGPVASTSSFGFGGYIAGFVGALFLLLLGFVFYNYIRTSQGKPAITLFPTTSTGPGSSGDKTPAPVDGKTRTVISAGDVPLSTGSDYGIQYWMYISDWDYNFGKEKPVLQRKSAGNDAVVNPFISLHPTDNSLNVRVSVYPSDNSAGAATPGADTTGDSYTCTVENVPLQSWFSVSVTVFQRNMDVYINGRLVKSVVLPGVPKPAVGDIVLNDAGGFSGSVCNVHSYNGMLSPADAKSFFSAGTACQAPAPTTGGAPPSSSNAFITIFGYTFRFSTIDKAGKELSSLTL